MIKLIFGIFVGFLMSLFIGCKPDVVNKTVKNFGDDVTKFLSSDEGKVAKRIVGAGAKIGYEVYKNRCSQCGGSGHISCGKCGASGQVLGMDPWGNAMPISCPVCTGRGLPPSMPCTACQ